MTAILKVSSAEQRRAASAALEAAGIGVVEVQDWREAAEAVRRDADSLLVCDGSAATQLAEGGSASPLSRDASRSLSHELRTPLSAMAGWIHLLESGKLDAAATQRAIEKLRGNIDDQVRTIDRFLGTSANQGKSPT